MNIEPTRPASRHDDLGTLLEHACAGDEKAMEHLLARLRERIHRWVVRFTRDVDDAEDVAQEVMVHLRGRVQRFDQRRSFASWLYVMTRRVSLSRQRTDERRKELLASVASDADMPEVSNEGTTDEAAALTALVVGYFDALPPRQRQVFEMAELRGLPQSVVARELGMQESTVRVHLFKARTSIRARLMERHEALVREYRS